MQTFPLVSVLMPAYNAEQFIEEAIESILNQSFTDFEFIIINDCSTDNTPKILERHANKDSRIAIINNEVNMGVANSLNEGLSLAKGKYIARMDADDISIYNRLQLQIDYMQDHSDCVICGSNIEFINEQGKSLGFRHYPVKDTKIKKQLSISNPFAHPSVMLQAETLKANALVYTTEFPRCEDYHLWFRLEEYGSFHNISQNLLRYRLPQTAVKSTACKEMLKDTIRLKVKMVKHFTTKSFIRIQVERLLLILPASIIYKLFCRLNGGNRK